MALSLFHIMIHDLFSSEKQVESITRLSTEFIQNINHDIRTSLNVIVGFSEIIAEGNCTNDEKKEFINIIKQNNKYLLRKINDSSECFSTLFSQEELTCEEINLNSLYMNLKKSYENILEDNSKVFFNNKMLTTHLFTDKKKLDFVFHHLILSSISIYPKSTIKIDCKINNARNRVRFYLACPTSGNSMIKTSKNSNERYQEKIHELETNLDFYISSMIVELLGGKIELKIDKQDTFIYSIILPIKAE